MKFYKHINRENNGFTLIEIIVTIVVLGVLMSLAIPRYSSVLEKTKAAEGAQILSTVLAAQKLFEFESGSLAINPDDLEIDTTALNPKHFSPPDISSASILQVATITRLNSAYVLEIDYNGVLDCSDLGSYTLCANLGY